MGADCLLKLVPMNSVRRDYRQIAAAPFLEILFYFMQLSLCAQTVYNRMILLLFTSSYCILTDEPMN